MSPEERIRKLLHMGFGLAAFALRPLGPLGSASLALAALLHNVFLFPRYGGRRLWRPDEVAAGRSMGMILYPTAVLLLILLCWRRLEVAAAAWGILAFGDGMAAVAGRAFGRRKLPWNPRKSWAGSLVYVASGAAAAAVLLMWTAPGRYELPFALFSALAAAVFSAALESLPQRLDDNLGVPLVTGLFLFALVGTQGGWELVADPGFLRRLGVGLGLNGALAAAAYLVRGLDRSGVVAGVVLGTLLWTFLGWQGYLLLACFFVLGTAVTRLGYARKAEMGLAHESEGRRGARHALANAAVGVACAVLAATTPFPMAYTLACAAAFATAAADTASSEVGQLWGRRTYLATTLRRVPPGTEGAVSLEGTLAGIAASAVVALTGAAAGLYDGSLATAVVAAAWIGTTVESLAGAGLGARGLLDNEALNFLSTLVGASVGFGIGRVWG